MSAKTDIKKVLIEIEHNAFKIGYETCEVHLGSRQGEESKHFITPYLERIMKIVEASDERA